MTWKRLAGAGWRALHMLFVSTHLRSTFAVFHSSQKYKKTPNTKSIDGMTLAHLDVQFLLPYKWVLFSGYLTDGGYSSTVWYYMSITQLMALTARWILKWSNASPDFRTRHGPFPCRSNESNGRLWSYQCGACASGRLHRRLHHGHGWQGRESHRNHGFLKTWRPIGSWTCWVSHDDIIIAWWY